MMGQPGDMNAFGGTRAPAVGTDSTDDAYGQPSNFGDDRGGTQDDYLAGSDRYGGSGGLDNSLSGSDQYAGALGQAGDALGNDFHGGADRFEGSSHARRRAELTGLAGDAALAGGAAALGAAGGAYAMHHRDESQMDRGGSYGQGYDSHGIGPSMPQPAGLSMADSSGLAGLDGQMGGLQMRDDHYPSSGGLDSYGGNQTLGMADNLMHDGAIDNFAGGSQGDRLGGRVYDDGLLHGERDAALLGSGGLGGQYDRSVGGGLERELGGGYLDRDLVGAGGHGGNYGYGNDVGGVGGLGGLGGEYGYDRGVGVGVGGLGGQHGYDRGVGGSYGIGGLSGGYDRGIGSSYGRAGFSEGYGLGGYSSLGGVGSHGAGYGYGSSSPYSYVGIDGGGYLPGARVHDQSLFYNPAVSTVRCG